MSKAERPGPVDTPAAQRDRWIAECNKLRQEVAELRHCVRAAVVVIDEATVYAPADVRGACAKVRALFENTLAGKYT